MRFPAKHRNRARGLLSGAIRFKILYALMYELLVGDYGSALKLYKDCDTLIELGRAKWPGQTHADGAGTSLTRTFSECCFLDDKQCCK